VSFRAIATESSDLVGRDLFFLRGVPLVTIGECYKKYAHPVHCR
jgi:hypothetical protein